MSPLYPGVVGATVPVASNASPIILQRGEYAYVFGVLSATATQLPINDNNVAVEKPAGQAVGAILSSIACDLQAPEPGQPQPLVTVEVSFAAAPGAGEQFVLQEADTDADAFYTALSIAGTINTFNANNVARVDLAGTIGKFLRVQRTVGANNLGCKVKFTKLA